MLAVPADLVWKWIEQNVELRAWYTANLIPPSFPGDSSSCSARELLVRYGDRDKVRHNASHARSAPRFHNSDYSMANVLGIFKANRHACEKDVSACHAVCHANRPAARSATRTFRLRIAGELAVTRNQVVADYPAE